MRRLLLWLGLVVLLGAGVAGGVAWGTRVRERPVAEPTGPRATAPVTRTTLTRSVTLTGELTYGAATPLTSAVPGMVTWLPSAGETVRRGQAVLRVNDQPVVLVYGELPVYRPMTLNVKGNDVRQFERNLAAMGYRGFTVDELFSPATVAAVKRWQHDLGRPETGVVDAGQVIVAPGSLRVAQPLVRVGASATGDVLSYTGSVRMVSLPVPAAQAGWADEGATVTVRLPGGRALPGTIRELTTGVAAPAPSGGDGEQAAGQSTDDSALTALIGVTDQRALRAAPAGPVDVTRTLEQRKQVLTVPVAALLALAEGGYGVELAPGGRIVAVKAGMFADGRVEVGGGGLTAGDLVGMPS